MSKSYTDDRKIMKPWEGGDLRLRLLHHSVFRFVGRIFNILSLKKFIECGLMNFESAHGMNAPRENG